MRKALVMGGIVLVLAVFVGVWIGMARSILSSLRESKQHANEAQIVPVPVAPLHEGVATENDPTPTDPLPEKKVFTEFTDQDIRKGQVQWQDPEDLGDLGWTISDVYKGTYQYINDQQEGQQLLHPVGGIRYVQVGTVIGGKYAGMDIVVLAVWIMNGPGEDAPYMYHFLKKNDQVVFLQYPDAPNNAEIPDDGNYFSNKSAIFGSQYLFKEDGINASKMPQFVFDEDTRIEELASFPDTFVGRTDREVFERDQYYSRGFFSENSLEKVFNKPDFGTVWIPKRVDSMEQRHALNAYQEISADSYQANRSDKTHRYVFETEYFEPLSVGGVYLKRQDGVLQAFKLKPDILDDQSHFMATWNDGTLNTSSYSNEPDSCGFHVYMNDVSDKINIEKDLKTLGKTQYGDVLYGLKNTHQKAFKEVYEEAVTSYLDSDTKKPFSNETEFLALKPLVYWVDPLGRLIEFHNTDAIQPIGGCGKPVVYLYPEKATDVSVKVFPSEGVSVSDPEYGEGWKVTAQPDGTLTNHADGKEYPYLFWEGGSDVLYKTPEQGFVTSADDLEMFFDEKLSQLGLSAKESADFKEFWIPKMKESNKPYYFVTFLSRQQIDRLAPLQIEPKPDTVIRVMMDYQGLDAWKHVSGYTLHAPERRGFTAVEWGGRLQK